MKRLLRALPIALLAALAVTVSGCGSTGTTASSSSESGAKLVRPGVVAFVTVNSDLESSQWKQLDELAKKFPGRDKALARIEHAFTKQGVDFKDDVEPALGPEVDLAVALGTGDRETAVVALTKPDDPDKFKALVAKLNASDSAGEKAVYREVGGWYALSDKQASIARVLASGGETLANDSDLQGGARPAVGRDTGEGVRRRAAAQRCDPAGGQGVALALRCVGLRRVRGRPVRSGRRERRGRRHPRPRRLERRQPRGRRLRLEAPRRRPRRRARLAERRRIGHGRSDREARGEPGVRRGAEALRGVARRSLRRRARPDPQRDRALRAARRPDPGGDARPRAEGREQGALDAGHGGGAHRGDDRRQGRVRHAGRARGQDGRTSASSRSITARPAARS